VSDLDIDSNDTNLDPQFEDNGEMCLAELGQFQEVSSSKEVKFEYKNIEIDSHWATPDIPEFSSSSQYVTGDRVWYLNSVDNSTKVF